jgi:protein kinase
MDKYNIIKTIGDGSYGTVYKAENKHTHEIIAIKRFKDNFESLDVALQLKEISSLKKLKHPNIVKMIEANIDNNELYLVYELLDDNVFEVMKHTGKPFLEGMVKNIM